MRRFAMRLMALFLLVPLAADGANWKQLRKQPDEWFKSDEAKAVAANVLAWQTELGDWPNDTDTFGEFHEGAKSKPGTFDDGHTAHETRFLVRMYAVTGKEIYRDAALKAIDHIMDAQYATGGFPQRSPPGDQYSRYITFNDGAMINLLELLNDVSTDEAFSFVGDDRQRVARRMVYAGIRCILACQVKNRHGLTAWGAQHDDRSLEPRAARSFEPASLDAAESAGVLRFLMSFENPSGEVVDAVEAGVAWLAEVRLREVRVDRSDDDVHIVTDPTAPPVWARFYDLDSMQPIFAGRDGIIKSSLAEIEQERRTGYAWYGEWGVEVFRDYANWPYRRK